MEHFDVMKFVKENDARIQRHYEKMQELERKEKELSFQQLYRNCPQTSQNNNKSNSNANFNVIQPLENIQHKPLNYQDQEPNQYTYELNSKPSRQSMNLNPDQEEQQHQLNPSFAKDNNDEEMAREYNYTPINPSCYKLSSNSPDNNENNSYLSNQRMGYGTNYNNDFTGISSLNITNNNLNDGLKNTQSAFATSKLSYNPINMQNEEYRPNDNMNNNNYSNSNNINSQINNFEFNNNIDTLGSSPLDSQKRTVNEDNHHIDYNAYVKQQQNSKDKDNEKGYGRISEEDNENTSELNKEKSNDKSNEKYKDQSQDKDLNSNNNNDKEYYQEYREDNNNNGSDAKYHHNQSNNKRKNKNGDLSNLKSGSLQNSNNTDEYRIDTKKSKKKTTPRFNSIQDDNTIEDSEYHLGNSNSKQQGQKHKYGYNETSAQVKGIGNIPYQKKPLSQRKNNHISSNNTSSTINSKKKYNGKMDNVSRMEQYNNYWKSKPYKKNIKKKVIEPEATPESRLKMNKLQFITPPLRYYTKM